MQFYLYENHDNQYFKKLLTVKKQGIPKTWCVFSALAVGLISNELGKGNRNAQGFLQAGLPSVNGGVVALQQGGYLGILQFEQAQMAYLDILPGQLGR